MPSRLFLAIFLVLAPQVTLVAQVDSPTAAQEVVAGQSILGKHAYFTDLMLELAPYPMDQSELELALRSLPVVEAWARTHPDLWSPNLAPANQISSYLAMPLWQETQMDGVATLALQMKLALFGEIFALELLDRAALETRVSALKVAAENPESTTAERSEAIAGRRHLSEIMHAFNELPDSKLTYLAIQPLAIQDLGERALRLQGYKQMPTGLPLAFVQPGNGIRFYAPKEWSRASLPDSALAIFQLLDPSLFVSFESYTLPEGQSLGIEHLATFASKFIERGAASKLADIHAPSGDGEVRHGFVDLVTNDPDGHLVVHSWTVGSQVFQLSFVSSSAPWSQAKVILDEILSHVEIGNTYQTLLADLSEKGVQIFADRSWKADAEPPLGIDARLSLAHSSLTVDLVVEGMREMKTVDLEVIENVHLLFAKDFREVELVANKTMEHGGNPSGSTEFTGVGLLDDEPVHMRIVVTFHNDQATIITIKSKPQDWDVALPALDELFLHMKFL
jgi:hypothetical protein